MDAHDEDKYYDDALTLMDAWWRKGGNAYELTPEDVANALRKAAADEREACAVIAQDHSRDFTLSDVCASEIAIEIRARAKGGV